MVTTTTTLLETFEHWYRYRVYDGQNKERGRMPDPANSYFFHKRSA